MIEIKAEKQGYTLFERGGIVGTFNTVKDLRETLRQLIYLKYSNSNNYLGLKKGDN